MIVIKFERRETRNQISVFSDGIHFQLSKPSLILNAFQGAWNVKLEWLLAGKLNYIIITIFIRR